MRAVSVVAFPTFGIPTEKQYVIEQRAQYNSWLVRMYLLEIGFVNGKRLFSTCCVMAFKIDEGLFSESFQEVDGWHYRKSNGSLIVHLT